MLIQFQNFITFENIYLWTNFGILPFWLMLIIIPNSKFTSFFLNSVVLPLILSVTYVYVFYQMILIDEPIFENFQLYLGIESLYTIFATEGFLLIFWIHFLALNIFLGTWIARDGVKYNISKIIVSVPLLLVYFTGPLGLVFYWIIRVFYAKKITFHD
jgi:hypothetical protein